MPAESHCLDPVALAPFDNVVPNSGLASDAAGLSPKTLLAVSPVMSEVTTRPPQFSHGPSAPPSRPRFVGTLLRSAASSMLAVAVEFALLTLLVSKLHVAYLIGAAAAGVAYFVVNFLLNRRWAFRARRTPVLPQLVRHGVVAGGSTLLILPLLWLFVSEFGMPYQLGWVVAASVAFLTWTFPMHRWFTFRGAHALGARR